MNPILLIGALGAWALLNRMPPKTAKRNAIKPADDNVRLGFNDKDKVAQTIDNDDAEHGAFIEANRAANREGHDQVLREHGLSDDSPDLSATVLEPDESETASEESAFTSQDNKAPTGEE